MFLLYVVAVAGEEWYVPILSGGGPFAVVLVFFAWAVINRKLTTPDECDALRVQNKELVSDLREVRKTMSTELIPLMTRNVDALERTGRIMERTVSVLDKGL